NMGKIQNVYRLTQAELVRLGDAINYLDDQNTVKGGELIDFLQRVGGSASLAKLTANDMAALGTTLISMGESADTAVTSVKALVSKMTLGSKSTKYAREAFKELGYSAQEVAKSMQLDSVKTIENFMKTVN
ncbi:phage tail tape measure protein, partial [Escherichia coli]|uniref:phage tail tape measure protein n=1 Tax=Escherichia coli TaxID=562 RepID=UPI001327D7AE